MASDNDDYDYDEDDDYDYDDDYDDLDIPENFVILDPDDLLVQGLLLVNYPQARIGRASEETNIRRFRLSYGCVPRAVVALWEDLQTTTIVEAFLPPEQRRVKFLLMALYQLRKYPTEADREKTFDISQAYSRRWVWLFIRKIQALKDQKILWPDDCPDIWVCSVDGTHVWVHEVAHEEFSLDPEYFSHKHNKSGLTFELGVSLREQRLLWVNGGFKAGRNDKQIFVEEGLRDLLSASGKRAIGDSGYEGYHEVSIPNSIDRRNVRKFKTRALKRHEKVNGYLKVFDCLKGRFRHSPDQLTECFEAACVLVQYQLDVGQNYLFDIVIENIYEDGQEDESSVDESSLDESSVDNSSA